MASTKIGVKLDNIGMTASTLCAIHCAVVPVFFTSLPLLGLGFLANPLIEWGMILLALIIGIASIGGSYTRSHHRVLPMLLLVAGFVIIIVGHVFTKGWLEAIIVPIGGFTVAFAHFVNYKYAGICNTSDKLFHLKHTHPQSNVHKNQAV